MSVMPRRRGCMFSSVASSGRPAKISRNCVAERVEAFLDRDLQEADAEILARARGIVDAARRVNTAWAW